LEGIATSIGFYLPKYWCYESLMLLASLIIHNNQVTLSLESAMVRVSYRGLMAPIMRETCRLGSDTDRDLSKAPRDKITKECG